MFDTELNINLNVLKEHEKDYFSMLYGTGSSSIGIRWLRGKVLQMYLQ